MWLLSDARNDAGLDRAIARLPRGSGVIFRHYHLAPDARRARFAEVRRRCRRHGHLLVLAGTAREARAWGAAASYGPPARGVALASVHGLREIARANRCGAKAVLLSPVFATRSHPGARGLGVVRFGLLASRCRMPAIALGGMTARRARTTPAAAWAAIDGLTADLSA